MDSCLSRYNFALDNEVEYKVHSQIDKDVERTFGAKSFFKQENIGYSIRDFNPRFDMLKRLLCALSQYKSMKYVQGMNFIAGAALYHCKEEFAYAVIV